MGRTRKFEWDDASKRRLVKCQTDQEMLRSFPMFAVSTLRVYKNKFTKELGAKPVQQDEKKFGQDHMVVFDTQVKPGVPTDMMRWFGQYAADKRPDVIIHVGDHWDMPSLSSYDKGKKSFEGRRYKADVEAGNEAFRLMDDEILNAEDYDPRKVFLFGNHEFRITRAVESAAELDGTIGLHDLDTRHWERYEFLDVATIDGVSYCHYFYNPLTGRPYGGQVATRLKTIGTSFVMGHQQVLDMAIRFVNGRSQHGLVCGASYIHDEAYLGYQGNAYWRGIAILHEVDQGSYDLMLVSLDYLCRRYEGMSLDEFLDTKYIRPSTPFDEWKER
jgi:hypothetical protein